jgi:hypothetical protein
LTVVRNPLDVIMSFATLANTMSHSGVIEFDFAKDYPVWWDWFVRVMADR